MSSVVTYWQLPNDEKEFFEFLRSTGNVLAVPDAWFDAKQELVPEPLLTFLENSDPTHFSFGLEECLPDLKVESHDFNGSIKFGFSLMASPLIGYDRGLPRNGELPQSNLCAYVNYPDVGATRLLDKNPSFVRWMKKVMSWARKASPEKLECNGFPYRATRRAKEAVSEGRIIAVLY
jgi:hypothetical protein